MAQPQKKAPIKKKATIADLKAKMGFGVTVEKGKVQGASNADKPMDWIVMPQAFQDAIKLPGFPQGYVSTICGHSNTGKSTLVNHAIVAAQRQGLIPVIYDTENNFDFKYAMDMGMEAEPVYGDVDTEVVNPETGEASIVTENKIVEYVGPFFYFNNSILIERYGDIDYSTGKRGQKKRTKAVIEDMVYSINEFLEYQANGDIEQGFLFIWDSVGSIGGLKSYNSKVGNNMFDAGTISAAFQDIMDSAIPSSRKISSPYTNSMILINKVWLDGTSNPIAPPSLEMKGGKSITYRSRLIVLLGGQLKASIKRLSAVSKGLTYNYGIQTKIKILKNQLPAPFNVTYEGEFICTDIGIIGTSKEEQEEFRKNHVNDILKKLAEIAENTGKKVEPINPIDLSFVEEEEELVVE
jgi:hypothetical protein